tara:strand:+ start:463 stop:1326 length:864 start_codon:yes stop_codon:yes gene_type:complete
MANQDYVVMTNGIGADPSGTYAQIETGFDKTVANGVVQWKPTSSSSVVADTGEVNVELAFTGANVVVDTGVTVTMTIAHTGTVNTTEANHSIVVTEDDGGNQATGALAAEAAITSNGTNVVIVWTSGTDALGTDATGTLTILSDIDEPVSTAYYGPVPVTGARGLTYYCPVTVDSEVTAQFEWTDDDCLSIDGVEQATWTAIGTVATNLADIDELTIDPEDNTAWAILDKIKYMRIKVVSTDADVGGVLDADIGAAFIQYDSPNSLESNLDFVGAGASIGGLGVDPS